MQGALNNLMQKATVLLLCNSIQASTAQSAIPSLSMGSLLPDAEYTKTHNLLQFLSHSAAQDNGTDFIFATQGCPETASSWSCPTKGLCRGLL